MLQAMTSSRRHWLRFMCDLTENWCQRAQFALIVARPKIRGEMLLRSRKSAKDWRILQFHMMLGKRLLKMEEEYRKQVLSTNALWGFFGTRMLMHEIHEGRKLSDTILKELLRNRSTRIRKLQASLSATAKAASDDAATADAEIRKLQALLSATAKAASDEAAKIELEIPRCIICLDAKPNIVMLCPSNHQLLCARCFAQEFPVLPVVLQIAQPHLCPVCRLPFSGHILVHLP